MAVACGRHARVRRADLGSADKQIPVRHAHRLAEAGRETRLEILEGADHWTVPKHERFQLVVREFLASVFSAVRR